MYNIKCGKIYNKKGVTFLSGSMYFYISNKGQIYKIPKPIYSTYKAVPELANQDVLITMLYYKTLNRKPHELSIISFHRAKLNDTGAYEFTQEEINNELVNFTNYAFSTADSLSLRDNPIPLPVAPNNIPTPIEKNALYSYLKEKYPKLWVNCPYLVEQLIKDMQNNFNELKSIVKEAYKKRAERGTQ